MSDFKGFGRIFLSACLAGGVIGEMVCKAGDETAGRRLTFSDARIGYRLSGFRPGLVPVLRRASAQGRPPSVSSGIPTVASSPALHNVCMSRALVAAAPVPF